MEWMKWKPEVLRAKDSSPETTCPNAILDFPSEQFQLLFLSTSHPNTSCQVSTQFVQKKKVKIRGMFEMNCLFLSEDFKFQVSPKVLISCPRSTPRG